MQVDKINELIQALIDYLNGNSNTSTNWLELILPFLGTLLGAFITLFSVRITNSKNKKEKRVAEIQRKLNDFYNPLLFLFKKDSAFFDIFNLEAKKVAQSAGIEYRTLDFLISGKHQSSTFSETDRYLLEEILIINSQISNLIIKNMGLIDKDLSQSLIELSRHYELLRLAEQGKIRNEDVYKKYVYPIDIKEKVQLKVDELYDELKKLDT